MPGRNDPCPCGSGKKYKNCHLRADEATPHALRVIRGGLAPSQAATSSGAMRLPPGAVVSSAWEVDLVPLATTIDDDPTARSTLLLVASGDLVLHAEILTHPPTDPGAIAALLAAAVVAACDDHGLRPDSIAVRHKILIAPLSAALAERDHPAAQARLSHSAPLRAVDAAVRGFHAHMGMPEHEGPRPHVSRPTTWAAWGLEREQLGRFFAAAERYYRAAPWRILMNEDTMRTRIRGGGTWWSMAMGAADEVYGLVMHADRTDVERIHLNSRSGDLSAVVESIIGATISLGFEPREELDKRMREEIRREQWPIASPDAYPMLFVLNTPGGGLGARQMEDLIAVLSAVPAFVERHAAGISGVVPVRLPLAYRHAASGVTITLEDEWV